MQSVLVCMCMHDYEMMHTSTSTFGTHIYSSPSPISTIQGWKMGTVVYWQSPSTHVKLVIVHLETL